MGLLDGEFTKPTILEHLSLRGLLRGSGITFVVLLVAIPYLAFGTFTAADKGGYIMGFLMALVCIWLLSGVLVAVTILAAIMQRFQRD
jgi:hypothetical protein